MSDPCAAAREWLDAAAASGQPADPRGLLDEPPSSTHPAALAVKAVAEQADPGPFLRRLREAIFLERRRVDRGDALLDLAREAVDGLAVETLKIAFGSHGPVEALGADLDRAAGLARRRSPEIGDTRLDGRAPYADWRAARARGRGAGSRRRARPRTPRCAASAPAPRRRSPRCAISRARAPPRSCGGSRSSSACGRSGCWAASCSRRRSSARSLALASSITSKSIPRPVSPMKCSNEIGSIRSAWARSCGSTNERSTRRPTRLRRSSTAVFGDE